MTLESLSANGHDQPKAKVFISYAREDLRFVEQLEAGLKARGIAPLIDKAEIYAFDEWWKRIEAVIGQADSFVFVISPDSIASDICRKEVDFAVSLNKRLAPILWRRVEDQDVPEAVAKINYIFFDDETGFDASAEKLAEALTTDIGWVRKHTEFGEAARRWAAAGRPGPRGLLLRSPVLEDAERWIAMRPPSAPPPTEDVQAFIAESRRGATQRRNVVTGSLAAGLVVALALAGLAGWQRVAAVQQRDEALLSQSRFLADRANQMLRTGDAGTSLLLAIEAMPDIASGIERPFIPEANHAAYRSIYGMHESHVFRHNNWVYEAVFSPDGRHLAAAASQTVMLWDVDSRKITAELFHVYSVAHLSFSPDSKYLATGSDQDGAVRIWNTSTGKLKLSLGEDDYLDRIRIVAVAFTSDGRRVLAATADMIRVWDVETGKRIFFSKQVEAVTAVAFSRDGRRVVTVSGEKAPRLWDLTTSRTVAMLTGHSNAVNSVAFSPDDRHVITGSNDGTARIWDTSTGKAGPVLTGHLYGVGNVAFSRDGRHVATTADAVRIWDAQTGQRIFALAGHAEGVTSVDFSPDARHIATASPDSSVRIWTASSRSKLLGKHERQVVDVRFNPDGRRAITASYDGTARVWDVQTGKAVAVLNHGQLVDVATFSPDGKLAATTGRRGDWGMPGDRRLNIWDAATGKKLSVFTGNNFDLYGADFSPDSRRVLTIGSDNSARIWDIGTGKVVAVLKHDQRISNVMFNPDGRHALTTSTGTTHIWDLTTGTRIKDVKGEAESVTSIFSSDGRRVATSEALSARIWDVSTGSTIAELKHANRVSHVAFSHDGRLLATSSDGGVRIWNIAKGKEISYLEGQYSAVFSPDDRFVATVQEDTVRISQLFVADKGLVEDAQEIVPRCLTRKQRVQLFLEPAPPAWCITRNKWPYQREDWKEWLRSKGHFTRLPLPLGDDEHLRR